MLTPVGKKMYAEARQKDSRTHRRQDGRHRRRERRLWHDPEGRMAPLGCRICPDYKLCGGLQPKADFYDCLQFCCSNPETCDRVCRNHPDYPDRVREVGTFRLDTVPRAPLLDAPALPQVVPVIYHGNRRSVPVRSEAVALSLYRMFTRRDGRPRFTTPEALREAFTIGRDTTVVLTGIDRDPPLERWWGLGEMRRRSVIRAMKMASIGLVTTPNYSLFTDRPRWDDLHAMKRIAIVHGEFLREGLPAALHVNSRTNADFRRWSSYVAARPEITHVAYEFTTGTAREGRLEQHAKWLAGLADKVKRPLPLIMRGGTELLPELAESFANITILETSIFMKTMMRQRAYAKSNTALGWKGSPTETGSPVDDLFADNHETVEAWLQNLPYHQPKKRA